MTENLTHAGDDLALDQTTAANEGPTTVRITGNPSPREQAIIMAAISGYQMELAAVAGAAEPEADSSPSGGSSEPDSSEPNPSDARGRLRAERRCPVCQEHFDSKHHLDDQTTVRTARSGSGTVCIDQEGDRVYVHTSK